MVFLHRDERFVALDKPSGLLVHRGWGDDAVTAVDLVSKALGARVFPVHRLDRATSGVLLMALDADSARLLHEQFEAGGADKHYHALVRGQPPDAGTIDHPIPRKEGGPRVPAVTEYRTLTRFSRVSWVLARPRTGRLHQVRRHLKHLGHPLIGDVNYGRGELNRLFRAEYDLHRLALHAASLTVLHPTTGLPTTIASPLPTDLQATLERLAAEGGRQGA